MPKPQDSSKKVMPPLAGDEPVFSQVQVDWIVEQAEDASRRAATSVRNRSVVGFLILLIGIGLTFYTDGRGRQDARGAIVDSGNAVAVASCNRDFELIDALRAAVMKGPPPNPEGVEAEVEEQFLRTYVLPDCREAKVVTTDPEDVGRTQTPHYPGDGTAISEGNTPSKE